ncbi:ubl-specific protease [Fusarium sporotrichioides]|uniref:Ubl-specific protease n=1 Tax=Fusarium sporotrichioides TaxID=5514 RepID=A0A395RL23_FUSSP|nr:ubl-specific protease [Fusarium sporotrichioides]
MITSIYTAVAGLGEALSKIIRPQSRQTPEGGSYRSGDQASSSRDDAGTAHDSELRWLDRDDLIVLMESYRNFSKSLSKVWECLERETREESNKDLAPLSANIVDNNGRDVTECFASQLKRVFQFLDRVYEIRTIVRIRDSNQSVPPVLDYGISPDFAGNLEAIKRFISGPALPLVCNNILHKHREYECGVSQAFVDRVALDIKAILRNLPAPSYVASHEYRQRLQNMFPPPRHTDFNMHPSLPGSFPESDEPRELSEQQPTQREIMQSPADESSKILKILEQSSTHPIVSRPGYLKSDYFHSNMVQMNINGTTPEDYRQILYETDAQRVLKDKYVNSFVRQTPLTTDQMGSVRSILRTRRKYPSKITPKRLSVARRPKAVRFTDDTISPRPRTHMGLEVPRRANHNGPGQTIAPTEGFQEQRPSWARQLFNIPTAAAENSPRDSIFAPSNFNIFRRRVEERNLYDPNVRIKELLDTPSLQLPISDASRAGIELQIEEVKQKAAEKARLAAEAAKREAEEKARQELEERLARSGGLRMPNKTLVAPVSSQWHQKAISTLRAAPAESLAKSAEGVDLRRHDFAKVVSATEWLNDEIVNASLLWLDRAINSAAGIKDVKQSTRKCFTLGSFFFKRLQDQGVRSTQRTLRRYGVEKRNFLDIDTILLPICEHSHWTLIVIRPSKRTLAHMDSINAGGNSTYTNRAMAWIKDVLEEKFVQDEWKVTLHEAPLQNNGHDCGVHTITNAICISLGLSPIDSYNAADMPTQRIRIACMLLNGGFTGDFDLRVY